MSDHARLSPSGSRKWFACPGSLTLEQFIPNMPNEYSDDGTACHQVLEWVLKRHIADDHEGVAADYIGEKIPVNGSDEAPRLLEFTDAMAEKTQTVIDHVLALAGDDVLTAEERVDFSEDIAIPGQFGTLDVCVIRAALKELCIGDAKFGYKPVSVIRNTQLMTYALAKYRQVELVYDIETVRFWIFQPMIRPEPFEWSCTIQELLQFAGTLRSKGCSVQLAEQEFAAVVCDEENDPQRPLPPYLDKHTLDGGVVDISRLFLTPSERLQEWSKTFLNPKPNDEECAFCRAMPFCPSVAGRLQAIADAEFDVVAEDEAAGQQVLERVSGLQSVDLSVAMQVAELMEDWIKAVRAEVERRLLRGEPVPEFGLELGRAGNREWSNPAEAEAEMKRMRLKIEEMYTLKLISPPQAEKLATPPKPKGRPKKVKPGESAPPPPPAGPMPIGPRQWKTLQKLITRSDPKPSVKPLALIKELYVPTQPNGDAFAAVPEDDAGDGSPELEEDLS